MSPPTAWNSITLKYRLDSDDGFFIMKNIPVLFLISLGRERIDELTGDHRLSRGEGNTDEVELGKSTSSRGRDTDAFFYP